MVRRCVIDGCESKSSLPEHQGVTFHSFPFDSKTRDKWIENCQLPANKNITKNILVCSRHFRRADFQPMKSGKYLLRNGACPSVFPWKKTNCLSVSVDSTQFSSDKLHKINTACTVEATIAQIMADTAELNRAACIVAKDSKRKSSLSEESLVGSPRSQNKTLLKTDGAIDFTPGVRLEVQEINGLWHSGKVVEVDNDDREVLIKFEELDKTKRAESEEWIPMKSPRLRLKSITKQIPTFKANEKCFARWTGSKKFPATVQKVLADNFYQVMFEDGFIKSVRGSHMTKIRSLAGKRSSQYLVKEERNTKSPPVLNSEILTSISDVSTNKPKHKKVSRKDWPLISLTTLDIDSLNLPKIPKDGEWTCHWVNDQPIGQEGFLMIGEHKKPTVIVDDWRLPLGWVKHMYQRSNVLGKWDVILVNPSGKRFRSKADLKQALEDIGQVYNPDIYDFSIHRRRAKDINAYVYTSDYKPPPKPSLSSPIKDPCNKLHNFSLSSFSKNPVVESTLPMDYMTLTNTKSVQITESVAQKVKRSASPNAERGDSPPKQSFGEDYAYVGGLKVQIVNNLFRCPHEDCCKNFRKENHLQIHIKHYHQDLIKLLGACPNMQDLALKRTREHPGSAEYPKNQIHYQQIPEKRHQQDLHHSRGDRKNCIPLKTDLPITSRMYTKTTDVISRPLISPVLSNGSLSIFPPLENTQERGIIATELCPEAVNETNQLGSPAQLHSRIAPIQPEVKKNRLSLMKKSSNHEARKGNRQRTTKKYLTTNQTNPVQPVQQQQSDVQFGSNDSEETRQSFNVAPDKPASTKKNKLLSLVVSDSAPDEIVSTLSFPDRCDSPKYIKENGELIKIVRMKQEEIINCPCSYGEEDGLMIQCELCLCWQHGGCNDINKESDVPDKYICYICRNPQRGRGSCKYIHDQDWMYGGKLPVASFHEQNPTHPERFELLKKSHTLTGNLIEVKRFLHSLQVKINMIANKDHPKMYLWEKRWDPIVKNIFKIEESTIKTEEDNVKINEVNKEEMSIIDNREKVNIEPHIPQPEAPIDPVECQHRLLEHIKVQQGLGMNRLDEIEIEVNALEALDNLLDLKSVDLEETKDVLASFKKDIETMEAISKINLLANNNNLVFLK